MSELDSNVHVDIVFDELGNWNAVAADLEAVLGADVAKLDALGDVQTRRASHVEPAPNNTGWMVDLTPVNGPILGPVRLRTDALAIERRYLSDVLGI